MRKHISTTARITQKYKIKNFSGKQVDYTLFLYPMQDREVANPEQLVRDIRNTIPENSVNHTSYPPLLCRPISVSIEPKRDGGSHKKANLQVGIWQLAQWRFLTDVAGSRAREFAFIPGIIIEGHEWKLVVTTNYGGKTV